MQSLCKKLDTKWPSVNRLSWCEWCYDYRYSCSRDWPKKLKILWKRANDGWGNYEMILLVLFLISSTLLPRNAQKNQNQKYTLCVCADFLWSAGNKECRAETYNIFFREFFGWVKYGKWCKFNEILCIKISENPRKGFLQSLDRGMNKIKNPIFFRTPHHSTFLLLSVMEFYCHPVRR